MNAFRDAHFAANPCRFCASIRSRLPLADLQRARHKSAVAGMTIAPNPSAMKPWFLVIVMGAISGAVVLRTALADPDSSRPKPTISTNAELVE